MSKTKTIVVTTVYLFLICAVTTLLLALTNSITAGPIAEGLAKKETDTCKLVLADATAFEKKTEGESTYYIGTDATGNTIGYVFSTEANGYSGPVSVMTGIDTRGVITGVQILNLTETPGLGMKATDPSFLEQYNGKSGELGVAKSNPGESDIQALTGATITSRAVTNAVNAALVQYQSITGGAK